MIIIQTFIIFFTNNHQYSWKLIKDQLWFFHIQNIKLPSKNLKPNFFLLCQLIYMSFFHLLYFLGSSCTWNILKGTFIHYVIDDGKSSRLSSSHLSKKNYLILEHIGFILWFITVFLYNLSYILWIEQSFCWIEKLELVIFFLMPLIPIC